MTYRDYPLVSSTTAQTYAVKNELVKKIDRYQDLQSTIGTLSTELQKTHTELQKTQLESQELRSTKASLDVKKNNLQKEITGCDARLTSLAADKMNLKANNKQIETEQAQIKADLNQIKIDKAKLEAEKEAIRSKRLQLEEQKKNQVKSVEKPVPPVRSLPVAPVKQDANSANIQKVRQSVWAVLPLVFSVTPDTVKTSFTIQQVDLFSVDEVKDCLIVSQAAMGAITQFLKSHKEVVRVNLLAFKDRIQDEALVDFFNAMPETGVKSLGLSKKLTEAEIKAQATAQASVQGLKIVNKAI